MRENKLHHRAGAIVGLSIYLHVIFCLLTVAVSGQEQHDGVFCDSGHHVRLDPSLTFPNDRLRLAYIALQAWKRAIFSDPKNITGDWVGTDVCGYSGVFCAGSVLDPNVTVVAGIDLNHGDIAGYLPDELKLLEDLALFHINSNRFCGTVPKKIHTMKLLFEFDISNNRFVGKFPHVVLKLPSLKFLDLRFNEFEGKVSFGIFFYYCYAATFSSSVVGFMIFFFGENRYRNRCSTRILMRFSSTTIGSRLIYRTTSETRRCPSSFWLTTSFMVAFRQVLPKWGRRSWRLYL